MIDFSKRLNSTAKSKKVNPIEIYNSLDRASMTGPLRPAQTRILEKWFSEKKDNKDLIVKLHTGAGKTLIGLLMALSYINAGKGPAIYVCPNVYLMQQACAEATKFGIPFCIVSPQSSEIPNDFIQGKSILISYVQKVFNGLSIFGIGNRSMNVGCIILDDSHACIDSMVGACTIQVNNDVEAYTQIMSLFERDLRAQGEGTYQDLINKKSNVVMPIPYWAWQNHIDEVTAILSKNTDDNNIKFAWPILKDQLVDCVVFVSANKIEISPMCLPINVFGIFNKAAHRILMSATTQEDTFFIKGLGLSIDAVKEPLVDEEYTWSGEKMILIPDSICENTDSEQIIRYLLTAEHDFGIVALTPSFEKSRKYEENGAIIVNKQGNDMYRTIKDFKENHKNKSLVFANRYDGIDLPDSSCRILLMDSVPYYDSLSDRYEELCRSTSEIIRIKTIQKIEQGLGRSVRGEKDYSVILIMGSDLIKYIRSITNQKLFSPQTRKQIEIGFQIVDMAKEDLSTSSPQSEAHLLFSTIDQCLNRDEGWKAYYADQMDNLSVETISKDKLYTLLQKEKEAFDYAAIRNYEKAFSVVQDIANSCEEDEEKGWYLQIAAKYQFHISQTKSNALQVAAFTKNNQLLKPIEGIVYNKLKHETNVSRNQRILGSLKKHIDYSELSIHLDEQLSNLSFGVEAEKFEYAFFEIGRLLGYSSQRPDKEIRQGPDVLWCISANRYALIECKSEVAETRRVITKSEAGQMEEHGSWFETEYGTEIEALHILAIPTATLAADAYFSRDVKIFRKRSLEKFKKKVKDFFKEFRSYDFNSLDVDFIQEKLVAHDMCDDFFIKSFLEKHIKN